MLACAISAVLLGGNGRCSIGVLGGADSSTPTALRITAREMAGLALPAETVTPVTSHSSLIYALREGERSG